MSYCSDCAAKDAVIRDLRDCLTRLETELVYIDACEPCMNAEPEKGCLCHSAEAKACIQDAEEMLWRTK